MKNNSHEKGWGNIIVAVLMVVFGVLKEPLMAVLGSMILITAGAAVLAERSSRRSEQVKVEKIFSKTY